MLWSKTKLILKPQQQKFLGGGEMGSMNILSSRVRWYVHLYIHIQIRINQLLVFIKKLSPLPGFEPPTSGVVSQVHIYESSVCRYVSLNGWNVLHVPRPRIIAPKFLLFQFSLVYQLTFSYKNIKNADTKNAACCCKNANSSCTQIFLE